VEPLIDNVAKRIGSEAQYEHFDFTHNTDHINLGPTSSLYHRLDDMVDKLEAQLILQSKIRAVDANDATSRLIDNHFLPDMYGNLRTLLQRRILT
jgi:DNA polymerase II large subunit